VRVRAQLRGNVVQKAEKTLQKRQKAEKSKGRKGQKAEKIALVCLLFTVQDCNIIIASEFYNNDVEV